LFTDDRQENVDVATQRGWNTHLFDGSQDCVDCLVGHGLLEYSDIGN
jgi:2-haloacid dehalogenase